MKIKVKKNFKKRRDFELNTEGYKAFRNQGWNGEYEEIEIQDDIDIDVHEKQIMNYLNGGSSKRCYEPVRIIKKR